MKADDFVLDPNRYEQMVKSYKDSLEHYEQVEASIRAGNMGGVTFFHSIPRAVGTLGEEQERIREEMRRKEFQEERREKEKDVLFKMIQATSNAGREGVDLFLGWLKSETPSVVADCFSGYFD